MTDPTQSCRTCRFANWEYTEHEKPRIKNDRAMCSAPIDVSAVRLPDSIQVVPNLAAYLDRSKHFIGPNCGEKCPCYEAAQPLPLRSQMAEELKAGEWKFNDHWKCWLDPNAPAYSGGYGTVHAWRKMKKEQETNHG